MQRTKSIFFKYFFICSAVILISFVCLGAVLLLVSSRYFTGEKRDLLTSNAQRAAHELQEIAVDGGSIQGEKAIRVLKNYSGICSAEFYVVDEAGNRLASSDDDTLSFQGDVKFPVELLDDDAEDAYCFESDLGGFYGEAHLNGVAEVRLEGKTCYIIASAPVSQQDSSVRSMLELYLLSAVIVLVVSMVIVYFTTVRLTSPIREMAEAAHRIGDGDFDVQLPEYEITEFNELGTAINEMSVSISNYDKMRSSFVANVSHELRTPMTSIGGFVDGIIDGTIPQNQQKKYLGLVSDEIKRLTRMVRSMLDLAKIESGSMELKPKPISIIEPIARTLFTFEKRIEEKNIDIRGLDVDRVIVYADENLIHQVVYNLIENSIKFVNKGGYIEFGFEDIGDVTEISITNSGDGLKEEELALVFDRFYKTDASRGMDTTGVGLGLNIVKSVIRLHGGSIRVTSVEGEYTRFIITLKNNSSTEG